MDNWWDINEVEAKRRQDALALQLIDAQQTFYGGVEQDVTQQNTLADQTRLEILDTAKSPDVQQVIDTAKFDAVPEHGSNMANLAERYGKEGVAECPYLKSMGAAGLELVQRLSQAEKSPDRGPTIRELMAASKKQAATPKPDVQKSQQHAHTTPDTQINQYITQQQIMQTAMVVEQAPQQQTALAEKSYEHRVKQPAKQRVVPQQSSAPVKLPTTQIINRPNTPKKPNLLSMVPALEARPAFRPAETKLNTLVDTPQTPKHEAIQPVTYEAKQPSIVEHTEQAPALKIILDMPAATPQPEHYQPPAIQTEKILPDAPAPHAAIAEAPTTTAKLAAELPPQQAAEVELQRVVSEYTADILPATAQIVQKKLESILEIINSIETSDIKQPDTLKTKQIDELVTELLQILGLPENTDIKRLIEQLRQPELITLVNKITLNIDQLNYMGTGEHRQTFVSNLFMALRHMAQQKKPPYQQLGTYTVAVSLA